MPYWHFLGQFWTILPLYFREIPYQYVAGPPWITTHTWLSERGAWFSTQNVAETVCRLVSDQVRWESSQHAPDLLAEFVEGNLRDREWIERKGRVKGKEREGSERKWQIPYRHFFFPLSALPYLILLILQVKPWVLPCFDKLSLVYLTGIGKLETLQYLLMICFWNLHRHTVYGNWLYLCSYVSSNCCSESMILIHMVIQKRESMYISDILLWK